MRMPVGSPVDNDVRPAADEHLSCDRLIGLQIFVEPGNGSVKHIAQIGC